jgi:hypothetical protein
MNTNTPPPSRHQGSGDASSRSKKVRSVCSAVPDTVRKIHAVLSEQLEAPAAPPVAATTAESRDSGEMDGSLEGCPQQWVTCWLDYTAKYGLGYQLADGSVGVYFNDSSKMVTSPDGTHALYVAYPPQPPRTFSMAAVPSELTKKATLIERFRVYFADVYSSKSPKCPFEEACMARARVVAASSSVPDPSSLVFVKKWQQTQTTVVFRLSDRTVQVNFYDGSSVVINSDAPRLAFLDKHGKRSHHGIATVSRQGRPDILKRLRFMKSILNTLMVSKHGLPTGTTAPLPTHK